MFAVLNTKNFFKFSLIVVSLLLTCLCHETFAQSITRLNKSKISFAALDQKIDSLMQAAEVHGLAITLFNKNEPVYKKTFGYKNAVTKEPLKTSTNIYGASLSKVVFAVLAMKLVEEGKLDLDKPLHEYLSKPIFEYKPEKKWHDDYSDLKNDTNYKKITARMCLAHTSGLPNWRWDNPGDKLKVNFEPGTKYGYSGEGMVYLQVVLEKMFGTTIEKMMQHKIFSPLGMKMSSYTWQPAFDKDYAIGHNTKGGLYEKDKDNDARAASTLETTLDDYSLFTRAVLKNSILKPSTTKQMLTPQLRLRSVQQHGPLRFRDTTANDGIKLSYGLGWVLLQSPYGPGAFKEGHGDGFQHYSIIFPKQQTGIIIMSNSDNAESIFKELLAFTIGDTYTPWYWENYIPYDQIKKPLAIESPKKITDQNEEYVCMPCGRDCDKDIHNAPGKCSHCNMQLVKKSTVNIKTIQPSEICSYLKKNPNVVLLDVRTKEEFEGKANPNFGSLQNAINIPIQELEKRLPEINGLKDREIILYCSHSRRSPQATYILSQLGFSNVTNMAGGMSVMKDEGCKK